MNNKGHIVNIGSIAGMIPGVKVSEYCPSKAAFNLYTNCLRLGIKLQFLYNLKI